MPAAPVQFLPSFLLLQQEGYLISSCIATGLTALRSAHVHNKGAFYSAMLNLSVGTERLMKAAIIIDFMLKNDLAVPTRRQLKTYGHDLAQLHASCVGISLCESRQVTSLEGMETAGREIFLLLNAFAQTTRYHNLDALSAPYSSKDPLAHWDEILLSILDIDVPARTKEKISRKGMEIAKAISGNAITIMQGLDKKALSTAQALVLPGLHEEAAKHAALHVVNFLCPLRDLLSDLSHKAYTIGVSDPPFPQMQEFLLWLWDDRDYVLRKKQWP